MNDIKIYCVGGKQAGKIISESASWIVDNLWQEVLIDEEKYICIRKQGGRFILFYLEASVEDSQLSNILMEL